MLGCILKYVSIPNVNNNNINFFKRYCNLLLFPFNIQSDQTSILKNKEYFDILILARRNLSHLHIQDCAYIRIFIYTYNEL